MSDAIPHAEFKGDELKYLDPSSYEIKNFKSNSKIENESINLEMPNDLKLHTLTREINSKD